MKEKLMAELQTEPAFTIPIRGGIDIPESGAVTWLIMALLVLASIILTRNLKLNNPGKRQLLLESGIGWLYDFFGDILGERGKCYIPWLCTVILYIGCANMTGLIGLKPPTKDLNVTAGLAVMSIILIEYSCLKVKGSKGFVHSFAEPMPIIAPLNVLELFIKPLSLCMRLFGNVVGAFVVMELIKLVVPAILPVPFSMYFDIFDGLIQAYVFVFLTSLFMKEAME